MVAIMPTLPKAALTPKRANLSPAPPLVPAVVVVVVPAHPTVLEVPLLVALTAAVAVAVAGKRFRLENQAGAALVALDAVVPVADAPSPACQHFII